MLGGGGLSAAFPRAYAIVMSALYLPVIVMLLALVFRGVAFEFRAVSRSKISSDLAFIGGSLIAALCQGAMLAGLLEGIKVENGAFAGGAFDWATPFAALCALGVAAATRSLARRGWRSRPRVRLPSAHVIRQNSSCWSSLRSWRSLVFGRRLLIHALPTADSPRSSCGRYRSQLPRLPPSRGARSSVVANCRRSLRRLGCSSSAISAL